MASQNKYSVNQRVEFTDDAHELNVHDVPRYIRGSKGLVKSYYRSENDGKYYYTIMQGMTAIEEVPEEAISIGREAEKIQAKVQAKLNEDQKNKAFKDIGRRVSGSAKERRAYDKIVFTDLDEIELDELTAIKLIVKDKVYPEVNIADEKSRGVSSGATYYKTKIRLSAPTKPSKNTAQTRAAYVRFIEKLTGDLHNCMTLDEVRKKIDSYLFWSPEEVIGYLLEPKFLTLPEENKEETRQRFASTFRTYTSYVVRKLLQEIFSIRFVNQLFVSSDAAREEYNTAKKYEPVTEEEAVIIRQRRKEGAIRFIEGNQSKIDEYRNADDAKLNILKRDWSLGAKSPYRTDNEQFRQFAIDYYTRRIDKVKNELNSIDTTIIARDNDWSWFESAKAKKEVTRSNELKINSGKPLDFIKRTNGLMISEEFVNASTSTDESNNPITRVFGFSTVQYGNALKDTEAKEHVRHFLGAMADLSEILNIELSALNRLGNLSIAFAARGKGSAMAHYEAAAKIINITNKRGDGTIAHEYGHFIDNMLYSLGKIGILTGYASDLKEVRTGYYGKKTVSETENEEVSKAVVELMNFIYKGKEGITGTVKFRFYPTAALKDGQTRQWKSFFSDDNKINYKAIPLATMEDTIAEYQKLSKVFRTVGNDKWWREYQAKLIGDLIRHFELPYYDVDITINTSQYFYYSSKMSSDYWVKPWELFARAWETYIADKLSKSNRTSNYLVSGYYFNMPIPTMNGELTFVYPFGSEREYLFALYENVVDALKKAYNLPSFQPFTDKRQDEYLSLESTEISTNNEPVDAGVEVEVNKENDTKTIEVIHDDKVVQQIAVDHLGNADNINPEMLPAPSVDDIKATIKGLQILSDMGDKDAEAAIKGLKLLI